MKDLRIGVLSIMSPDCREAMDLPHTTTPSYYGDTISRSLQGSDDIAELIVDSSSTTAIPIETSQSACCSKEESFVEPDENSLSDCRRATDSRAYESRDVTRMSPSDTWVGGFVKSFGRSERRINITGSPSVLLATQKINTKSTKTAEGCESTINAKTATMKQNNQSIDVGSTDQEELHMVSKHDSLQKQNLRHEVSYGEEEISKEEDIKISTECPKDTATNLSPKNRIGVSKTQNSGKPRLTLSAFRRPEQTVRVTDADPSRILSEEYDIHSSQCRILGHGGAATVRLAIRRRDGVKVAVKSIAKHDALRARRLRRRNRRHLDEWEILKCFNDHPNTVSLEDLFESDEDIHVVMEYCSGGELFDAIQKKRRESYTESQAAYITSQMLSALKDLHARGIIHRDVKPENILLVNDDESDVRVKLADFGVARVLVPHTDGSESDTSSSDGEASPLTPPSKRSRAYSCVGTDYYAAPEVCAGEGYDTAVDVYSLGVSLYVLLSGVPPSYASGIESETDEDDENDSSGVVFPSSDWKNVSKKAKQLIRKMLHPDPDQRITVTEALQDEWILEHSDNKKFGEATTIVQTNDTSSSTDIPRVSSGLDLDLLRNALYDKLDLATAAAETRKRGGFSSKSRSKKKRKTSKNSNNSMSSLAVMADLHRVVASVATSASAAAAGVMLDEFDEDVVRVVVEAADTANSTNGKDGKDATQFGSSLPLSV